MFSLIITIISIALVAALALATLYYGGDAFNQGTSEAEASKLLNQGQQLLGAAELYKASTGAFPKDLATLEADGYLKTIPQARTAIADAVAAGAKWEMPTDYVPVFTLAYDVKAVCAKVNKTGYGLEGILEQARSFAVTQCYGANSAYTVAMGRTASDIVTALPPAVVTENPIPSPTTTGEWDTPPVITTAGGTGSTGSGTGGTGSTGETGGSEGTPAAAPTAPLQVTISSKFGGPSPVLRTDGNGSYYDVGDIGSETAYNYRVVFTNNTGSPITGLTAQTGDMMTDPETTSPFGIDFPSCGTLAVNQTCETTLYVSFGLNAAQDYMDSIVYTYSVDGVESTAQSARVFVGEESNP